MSLWQRCRREEKSADVATIQTSLTLLKVNLCCCEDITGKKGGKRTTWIHVTDSYLNYKIIINQLQQVIKELDIWNLK